MKYANTAETYVVRNEEVGERRELITLVNPLNHIHCRSDLQRTVSSIRIMLLTGLRLSSHWGFHPAMDTGHSEASVQALKPLFKPRSHLLKSPKRGSSYRAWNARDPSGGSQREHSMVGELQDDLSQSQIRLQESLVC